MNKSTPISNSISETLQIVFMSDDVIRKKFNRMQKLFFQKSDDLLNSLLMYYENEDNKLGNFERNEHYQCEIEENLINLSLEIVDRLEDLSSHLTSKREKIIIAFCLEYATRFECVKQFFKKFLIKNYKVKDIKKSMFSLDVILSDEHNDSIYRDHEVDIKEVIEELIKNHLSENFKIKLIKK